MFDHGEKSPDTAVDAPTRQTVEVEFAVEMKKTVESLQVSHWFQDLTGDLSSLLLRRIGNAGKLRCQSEEFNKLDSLPVSSRDLGQSELLAFDFIHIDP